MIKRYRGWQRIAALLLSCSSTSVFAQLPASNPSPLNQLGRSWGFGISDGYHECPECKRPAAYSRMAALPVGVSHTVPCIQREQKPSLFSKMNPFKDANAGGHPQSCGPDGNHSMTILPPSKQMYQQFAAPSETPLPGSNYHSTEPSSLSNQSISPPPLGAPGTIAPESFPSSPGIRVPDPIELDSVDDQNFRNGAPQLPQQDTVPPPPALRKRQKGDKPLGEEENSKLPREPVQGDPADKPADKGDDSLDLLPKEEPPPITIHRQPRAGRSLISHSKSLPEPRTVNSPMDPRDAMLRQYYGRAYSRQELPEPTQSGVSVEREIPPPPSVNRYRYR